jgi:hypothetical protein
MWSRTLVTEEDIADVGPQRKNNKNYFEENVSAVDNNKVV